MMAGAVSLCFYTANSSSAPSGRIKPVPLKPLVVCWGFFSDWVLVIYQVGLKEEFHSANMQALKVPARWRWERVSSSLPRVPVWKGFIVSQLFSPETLLKYRSASTLCVK